jgi:hypothetical protein
LDRMKSISKWRWFALVIWVFIGYLLFCVGLDLYAFAKLWGGTITFSSKRALLFMAFGLFASVGWFFGWLVQWKWNWFSKSICILQGRLANLPSWSRWFTAVILTLIPAVLFMYTEVGNIPVGYSLRLLISIGVTFAALWVVYPKTWRDNWVLKYALMTLLLGVFFTAAKRLVFVVDYPFDVSWTEGNRIWGYSMLFGRDRYLIPNAGNFSLLGEIKRQAVWAIWGAAFLIPGINILGVRLWDALLWIIPPLLLGWSLVRVGKNGPASFLWQAVFSSWVYLFVSQGPVYAPLVLSAALVVWGVKRKNLALAALFVLLAGYYAAISRYTWTYAPGIWAAMLALLYQPSPAFTRRGWKQLIRPAVLGLVGLFGGQFLPKLVDYFFIRSSTKAGLVFSGIDVTEAISSQPLIWSRLFPNETYGPGVLLGLLLVILPVVILLFWMWRKDSWQPNLLQGLGILGPLLAFLSVGLIVSIKIGGGNNLHNLDMFLICLVMVAAVALEKIGRVGLNRQSLTGGLLLLLSVTLIVPTLYTLQDGNPADVPPSTEAQEALQTIRAEVAAAQQEGEVLFIDQRQLLTFGNVEKIPLVSEYEKRYLMNQAMSNNANYFKGFYQDLERHRFSLIVCEPLRIQYQGDTHHFGEENDAWVKWIAEPILQYYEPLETLDTAGIQLLTPRSGVGLLYQD